MGRLGPPDSGTLFTSKNQKQDKGEEKTMSKHDYVKVINPVILEDTLSQLDAVMQDVIAAGTAREQSYGEKKELLKRKFELEGRIEVEEATALMAVKGEGKDAHAVVNGEKVSLTNDAARTAYRRYASKEARQELAHVEAQLAQLDIDRFKANDSWETAKAAADLVEGKARLQASLLEFLK